MNAAIKRLYLKIVQTEGSPKSIGRAAAIGLACGLIIPIGLQTFPALCLAFIFKANKVLAWTFTCITNPATVFVIYPVQCWLGSCILFNPLSRETFASQFDTLVKADSFTAGISAFAALGWDIMLPFFAGGILFAVIAAPIGYIACYKLSDAYQKQRERRRKAKRQQEDGRQ